MRAWNWTDLVTNHQTGKLRESVIWAHAAKASALGAYIAYVNAQNYELMTVVMSTLLIGHEVVKTAQSQTQQRIEKEVPK